MKNPHMGSTLESFLEEEGIHEGATLKATKAVIAWQIAQVMKEEELTKTAMAKRIGHKPLAARVNSSTLPLMSPWKWW